ncbi:MAG: hypothetical protein F2574_03020 [Actinobacteria bacterium]|jgi:hypothetical protein|uniref:Unannotated protein n=1 Tax=freshwater metagenome TaxID=449393 RepID=A0A6J6FWS7_9ZZZZ|nr:hypothetical protein [Actinomycetota bacterium]
MAKSYKRELSELGNASGAVASNAGKILADAARLAARYSRDEIAPRARSEYSEHLVPLIASGLAASRRYLGGKVVPAKRSMGFGGFVLAGLGVALVAGVAYVAWQTLRTDDGAWTNDDFDVD